MDTRLVLILAVVPCLQGTILLLNNGTAIDVVNTIYMGFRVNMVENLTDAVFLEYKLTKTGSVIIIYVEDGEIRHTGRRPKDSNPTSSLAPRLFQVGGIAFDWLANNLYYTTPYDFDAKIEVVNFYTLYRNGLDRPTNVAVDPKERYMFWTDRDGINRAGMDGKHTRRIINRKISPNKKCWVFQSLTIDFDESRIFWSCSGSSGADYNDDLSVIKSTDYNGENMGHVIESTKSSFVGLDVLGDDLYILMDNDINYRHSAFGKKYSFFIRNKESGAEHRSLDNSINVNTVKVFDRNRDSGGSSPCTINNGGCSHLCILTREDPYYACACPTGVDFLNGSNSECADGIKNILLLAEDYYLKKVSLDTTDYVAEDLLPVNDMLDRLSRDILDVDYDPVDGYVYWLQERESHIDLFFSKDIVRVRLNGTDKEVVLSEGEEVMRMIAVNKEDRSLYWVERHNNYVIKSASLDGRSPKIVLSFENEALITDLVVHAGKGLIFWVNEENDFSPKIEVANIDGSNRKIIVQTNLTNPSGLVIDEAAYKLYWIDMSHDYLPRTIERSNLDGSERIVIVTARMPRGGFASLTLLGDYLYFPYIGNANPYDHRLVRVNKDTGDSREDILTSFRFPLAMKAINLE